MCIEALVPYEQAVPLEVAGLPAGVYTVTVNGISDTFELAVDNVLPPSQLRVKSWLLGALTLCRPGW